MAICYILYSEQLDRYFIGHTEDHLSERIRRHLTNHTGFTSKAKDWILVYQKSFATKQEAYQRERQIKAWKSRKRIKSLVEGNGSTGSDPPDL